MDKEHKDFNLELLPKDNVNPLEEKEPVFKNYKEKQLYYKLKSKQARVFHISNSIWKDKTTGKVTKKEGVTYRKEKVNG